jgi:uncharacterized protein (DUF849 family)
MQWFEQALQAIMEGKDVEHELNKAQHKAEAFMNCLATRQDLQENELVQACGAQVEAPEP